MEPSTRTPEGEPSRCSVCGKPLRIEPSRPPGDAPCPHCGHLLWFDPKAPKHFELDQRNRLDKAFEPAEPRSSQALATDYLLAIIEACDRHAVKAIPLLRVALKDPDWNVRLAAANALARMGPIAKETLPALHLLLQDKNRLVRDAAEEAIKGIDK